MALFPVLHCHARTGAPGPVTVCSTLTASGPASAPTLGHCPFPVHRGGAVGQPISKPRGVNSPANEAGAMSALFVVPEPCASMDKCPEPAQPAAGPGSGPCSASNATFTEPK